MNRNRKKWCEWRIVRNIIYYGRSVCGISRDNCTISSSDLNKSRQEHKNTRNKIEGKMHYAYFIVLQKKQLPFILFEINQNCRSYCCVTYKTPDNFQHHRYRRRLLSILFGAQKPYVTWTVVSGVCASSRRSVLLMYRMRGVLLTRIQIDIKRLQRDEFASFFV